VTNKEAFLFTDGRYYLQAEKQLDKLAQPKFNLHAETYQKFAIQELDFDEKWPSKCSYVARIPLEGEMLYDFRLT
jgi:hypothetical protein